MKEINVDFGVDHRMVALQLLSLLHVILACIATAVILKKRKELNFGILPALLAAWLIPYVGPTCILWGLKNPHLQKSA